MITRTFKLCLNAGTGSAPYINVSQYDEGETWLFELYSETGERYIPSSGAIVGVKSDGHGIANTGTVDSEGRVVITETQQMTASAGRAIYELSIDGLTHGTANFIVAVERKPTDDAVMSDSDLSLIQEAIDSAEVIVEVIGDGDPSEVIGEHVDAWLDNHPEATTTVQDGAITAPKINSTLWDKLLVSEEASGAVASFDDGADDVPVSSLKVALEPVQLGSGDPSPSNVRPIIAANGKNLYPIKIGRDVWENNASGTHSTDNDVLTVTVTTASSSGVYSTGTSQFASLTPTLTGTYSYSLSAKASANGSYILGFYGAGRETKAVTTQWQRFTFTGTFDGTGKTFNIYGTDTAGTIEIKDFMLETGSTASAYQPYQGIMVERCGKNLANVPNATTTQANVTFTVSDGIATTSGTAGASSYIVIGTAHLKGGVEYTITGCPSGGGSGKYGISIRDTSAYLVKDYGSGATYTPTGDMDVNVCIRYWYNFNLSDLTFKPMIRPSSDTDDTFAPYIGTSYPVSLGREVYGGTVDLATGVLTVDRVCKTLTTARNLSGTYQGSIIYNQGSPETSDADFTKPIICNRLKYVGNWTTDFTVGTVINYNNVSFNLWLKDGAFSSLSEATALLNENETQICYYLATPNTIQLTPKQVTSLLGVNHIFADCGDVEVIYRADTKLYVDKMTAVDNNIIAPTEATFTASRNYTVNDLVIVADTLYKVTANIANGGTITPNSNVQQTTLSALIKALS